MTPYQAYVHACTRGYGWRPLWRPSCSFLAETSVRPPRKCIIFIIFKKNADESIQNTFNLILKTEASTNLYIKLNSVEHKDATIVKTSQTYEDRCFCLQAETSVRQPGKSSKNIIQNTVYGIKASQTILNNY